MATDLRSPFTYMGGKSQVADRIWARLGAVTNYIEPFFGSGAVLLARPDPWTGTETVNDLDGFIANFWRALRAVPDEVAAHADWPVNENDLHARHIWLVNHRDSLTARLEGDPEFYDAKIAGWWVWGINCWIGGGWCAGDGPWQAIDGQLVHLGDAGRGVHRQRVHLGDAGEGLRGWMRALAARLRYVRVCSGDWSRICGPTPTTKQGLTGVLLDPPYADTAGRDYGIYAKDSLTVAHDVREWAIAHGDDPLLRIVLCGYEGEHEMPASWECVSWKARGGYGSQGNSVGRDNARRERLWCSPYCLRPTRGQSRLFDSSAGEDAAIEEMTCTDC